MRRLLVALSTIALLLPANAFARGTFDPTTEFEQNEWIPIHLGPINMSITKAVAYLMLGTVATIAVGLVFMRSKIGRKPGRKKSKSHTHKQVALTLVERGGGARSFQIDKANAQNIEPIIAVEAPTPIALARSPE